jgi:PAS domain-containing protein
MAAIDSTAPEDAAAELASLRARVASLEAEAQRLRASVRVANAVIEETPLVIYAKGADQRFLLSNRRHASLIGLPPASILGHTDRELFGADADSIDAASARVLASGASSSSEFPLPIDGRERFFHETIFRLHDEGGAASGASRSTSPPAGSPKTRTACSPSRWSRATRPSW